MGRTKDRPKTLLKGKSNYAVWTTACRMELHAEDAIKALDKTPPVNPDEVPDERRDILVAEWLDTREEPPDGGWSIQKVTKNRAQWKVAAEEAYDKWSTLNSKALGIIYNLCEDYTKTVIANETTAKGAWDRLAEAYKQQG